MDPQHQKILTQCLPQLVKQVNPQQLLIYLPCLSQYSKEEIETAQTSRSRSIAAQMLYNHLIRKPDGFDQLVTALRNPEVNCTDLADCLNPNPADYSTGNRNGGRQEYLYRRLSHPGHGHFQHNNVPESPGASDWQAPISPGTAGRQVPVSPGAAVWQAQDSPSTAGRLAPVSPGAAGWQVSLSPSTTGRLNPVSPGAAGWQVPLSPSTTGRLTPVSPGAAGPGANICDLNTTWGKLPGGVQTVLKKFDTHRSLKTVEDLADKLGFNNEEIDEVKCQVPQGESLTLAFLNYWIQKQAKEPTLWDIMKLFHDLERIDILQELEKKTGVKFEGPNEGVSPQADILTQHMEGASAQVRNVANVDRTHDDPNINSPTAKNHGNDKILFDVGADRNISNRQILKKECQYPCNIESAVGLRQTLSELDSRNFGHLPQNVSEVRPIASDSSVENNEKDGKDIEKFVGYKEKDIVGSCRAFVYKNQEDNLEQGGKGISYKKTGKKLSRELSRELSPGKVNDGSEGFQVYQTNQDDDKEIQVEKNNLDRSVSSCSSNTDNSTYDSMPDATYINDLNSGDEKRSMNPQPSKISNAVDESGIEGKCNSSKDIAETKQVEGMLREDITFQNNVIVKADHSEMLSETKTVADNSEHYLQPGGPPKLVSDVDRLKEEFSQMEFEQKIFEAGLNFSNIISKSDPPESRNTSVLRLDVSLSPSSFTDDRMDDLKTKNVTGTHSIDHYEDYSLEDERQAVPKHSNYSKELNSIEKKAAKKIPGPKDSLRSEDLEVSNGFDDNPTGSFQFEWDLKGADSTDGESEGASTANQASDQQLHQSSNALQNQGQQHTDIGEVIETGAEMEFTRRGPDLQTSQTNQNAKQRKCRDIVGNMLSEENVLVNTAEAVEAITLNMANTTPAPLNMARDENKTVNIDSLNNSCVAENKVHDADSRNNVCTRDNQNQKKLSLKDSCKTMLRVITAVYENI